MTNVILAADGVTVEFLGLRALDAVSLSLAQGDILGLIGPNGSGKTTFLNAITGHVPLAGGRITLRGETISGLVPREIGRRHIARTFQIGRDFANLTVIENIAIGALGQGVPMREARRIAVGQLERFGLKDRADDLARTLSYGDKRRVEIARALAGDPLFLLLDEPAAGMNDEETEVLLEILKELPRERNLGMLIIDHDMGLIMRLCRNLHVLASGRTIAKGDRASVRNDPAVIEAYLGSGAVDA